MEFSARYAAPARRCQELTRGCAMAGDPKFESLGQCVDVEHTSGVDEATNLWIGLGIYIAAGAYLPVIPQFWIVFVTSILVAIAIALVKASEMKDWISHCKFSKSATYHSLEEELSAYRSAAGG